MALSFKEIQGFLDETDTFEDAENFIVQGIIDKSKAGGAVTSNIPKKNMIEAMDEKTDEENVQSQPSNGDSKSKKNDNDIKIVDLVASSLRRGNRSRPIPRKKSSEDISRDRSQPSPLAPHEEPRGNESNQSNDSDDRSNERISDISNERSTEDSADTSQTTEQSVLQQDERRGLKGRRARQRERAPKDNASLSQVQDLFEKFSHKQVLSP